MGTALLAALALLGSAPSSASPAPPAANPFPEQVIEPTPARSHAWAYAAFAGGVALIATSFVFAEHGNDTYAEYLAATDPTRIEDLYDETRRYDRLASGTLITGDALIATALYLRFLRRPPPARVSIGVSRCAVAWRF